MADTPHDPATDLEVETIEGRCLGDPGPVLVVEVLRLIARIDAEKARADQAEADLARRVAVVPGQSES